MSFEGVKFQLLHINMRRFRGGLVFKAHRLCVSLNSRRCVSLDSSLQRNKEGEDIHFFLNAGDVTTLCGHRETETERESERERKREG